MHFSTVQGDSVYKLLNIEYYVCPAKHSDYFTSVAMCKIEKKQTSTTDSKL